MGAGGKMPPLPENNVTARRGGIVPPALHSHACAWEYFMTKRTKQDTSAF